MKMIYLILLLILARYTTSTVELEFWKDNTNEDCDGPRSNSLYLENEVCQRVGNVSLMVECDCQYFDCFLYFWTKSSSCVGSGPAYYPHSAEISLPAVSGVCAASPFSPFKISCLVAQDHSVTYIMIGVVFFVITGLIVGVFTFLQRRYQLLSKGISKIKERLCLSGDIKPIPLLEEENELKSINSINNEETLTDDGDIKPISLLEEENDLESNNSTNNEETVRDDGDIKSIPLLEEENELKSNNSINNVETVRDDGDIKSIPLLEEENDLESNNSINVETVRDDGDIKPIPLLEEENDLESNNSINND